MGDEGCCLGKEVQETPCFCFFSQTASIFCLKMIMFEIHNHFLKKGPFLSRQLESFPDSLLFSMRPPFLPVQPKNLRRKIAGAANRHYLYTANKDPLGCLNFHPNLFYRVWDTCQSTWLTKNKLLLIKKISKSMKETVSMKMSVSSVVPP